MKSKPIIFDGIMTTPHITKGTPAPLPEPLFRKFEALCCRLSPENLSCDGELPRYAVQAKLRGLRREWAALEKSAGRRVDLREVEDRLNVEYAANRKAGRVFG